MTPAIVMAVYLVAGLLAFWHDIVRPYEKKR